MRLELDGKLLDEHRFLSQLWLNSEESMDKIVEEKASPEYKAWRSERLKEKRDAKSKGIIID